MGEAAKLFTRSLMLGLDSGIRKAEFAEPTAEEIENLPYAEAVEYLKKRDVIKKVDYNNLSDKMKFRAFTASRINDGKLLEKLNAEMLANVHDGKGLKDFLSLTKTDILDKIGMGPNQGWYWETVYRTNVQTAYNVGRAMGFEEDKPLALEFIGIDDARQTDVCHSLMGIVRPYDDPFWQTHFPPLHFNCRSTVRPIYDESEIPAEWSKLDGAESPAKGFGTYPLSSDSWWEELDSQVRQAKHFGVQGEIEAARKKLIVDKVSEPTKDELIQKLVQAIEQKRTEQMPEKIYGYNNMKPKEKRKAICDWLIRKGMMSGKERIFISSPNGKPVFIRLGDAASVSLEGTANKKLISAEKDSLILFHNHPYSGTFSYADMQTLNKYESLKEILAVGHNGTVYSLKAGKRMDDKFLRLLFKQCGTEPKSIEKLVKNYEWTYTVKRRS